MNQIATITLAGLGIIAMAIAIALLSALPIWLAWNAIVPAIFGLPTLTFGQAIWLSILSSCLFKSTSSSSSKD